MVITSHFSSSLDKCDNKTDSMFSFKMGTINNVGLSHFL